MPQTVELPDDLADALRHEGSRQGMSFPDYAVRLLATARPTSTSIQNGAELVAFWQAEGVVGSKSHIVDSSAEARRLRDEAQRRGS